MVTDPPASPARPSANSTPPAAVLLRRLRMFVGQHGRFTAAITVVVALLVAVTVTRTYGPAGAGLVLGPIAAVALVALSRRWGLSWADLGLSRHTWAKGALYAGAAVAAVVVVYAVAALVPLTRSAFLDVRYQLGTGPALITALVVIPLGTVLIEEIAFRGVMQGLVTRHRGIGWGLGVSAVLFGAWHILPSLGLTNVNPAVSSVAGNSAGAQIGVVLAAVAFTAIAGLLLGELRRRSGSLLAAGGLHWAVNGVGVLVAAVLHAAG